jgi:hypothetical protein
VHLQPRKGQPFDAELTVVTMAPVQGQRPSLLWHLRDITARKHAEAARSAAMEQLHLVTDAMAVPVTR